MWSNEDAHRLALEDIEDRNKAYDPFCRSPSENKRTYSPIELVEKIKSIFEGSIQRKHSAVLYKDSNGMLVPITKVYVSKGSMLPSRHGFSGDHIWFDTGWE